MIAAVKTHEVIWCVDEDGKRVLVGKRVNRQQSSADILIESAAFSVCSRVRLLESGTRYYETPLFSPITMIEAFDIDTPEDLAMARSICPVHDRTRDVR